VAGTWHLCHCHDFQFWKPAQFLQREIRVDGENCVAAEDVCRTSDLMNVFKVHHCYVTGHDCDLLQLCILPFVLIYHSIRDCGELGPDFNSHTSTKVAFQRDLNDDVTDTGANVNEYITWQDWVKRFNHGGDSNR
jgi:hypothetical protein